MTTEEERDSQIRKEKQEKQNQYKRKWRASKEKQYCDCCKSEVAYTSFQRHLKSGKHKYLLEYSQTCQEKHKIMTGEDLANIYKHFFTKFEDRTKAYFDKTKRVSL